MQILHANSLVHLQTEKTKLCSSDTILKWWETTKTNVIIVETLPSLYYTVTQIIPPPVAIFLGRWSFREYGNQNQIPVVLLTPDIPRRYFFLGTGNQECNITWYKNLHSFMAMKKRIIWSVLPKWFYWTWCMVNHRRMVWLGQEFLIWLVSLANVKWGHIIYNYFM